MPAKRIAPVHPGKVLMKDFLTPLGISQYRVARNTCLPQSRIAAIVRGKRAVTAETALRFGRFFGTSAEFWLNIQARYDLETARDALGDRLDGEVKPLAA